MFTIDDFQGRVAVVTGAASGIGMGIAQRFVEEGMTVVLSDIDANGVAQTASDLGTFGVQTDVTDPVAVESLARTVMEKYGSIDILVNNAGVGSMGRIKDLTLADWRWMADVNLFGVIHGINAFLPFLVENPRGGFIVNTSSMAGLTTNPGIAMAAYTATKMGVVGLTGVLNKELAADEARVGASVLCPGPVHSQISKGLQARPAGETGGLFDVDASAEGPLASMRWMEPSEVADLVISAIKRGDEFIITHPELWPVVKEHHDAIRTAFGVAD